MLCVEMLVNAGYSRRRNTCQKMSSANFLKTKRDFILYMQATVIFVHAAVIFVHAGYSPFFVYSFKREILMLSLQKTEVM